MIIPIAIDETEEDFLLLSKNIKAEFYFAVDEDYDDEWPYKYGAVIRIRGFGLGRALDVAFEAAMRDSCEVFVRTDNHVLFPQGIKTPKYPAEMPYMCTYDGNCYGTSYITPKMETVFTWRPVAVPATAEPVMVFVRPLLEIMRWKFGCFFCTEYWGGENYNISAQSAELGYPIIVRSDYSGYHKFRPSWSPKRVDRKLPREPCLEQMPGNTYFNGITVSKIMYIIRHYKNPYIANQYDAKIAEHVRKCYINARNVGNILDVYTSLGL
ncbi:MAG: hypothetical protein JZD41_03590 [Thermoproteus sp.]|nr:hypothetical protein [Thermoproteus sp.]